MRLLVLLAIAVLATPAVAAQPGGDAAASTRVTQGTLWWRTTAHDTPAAAPLLATDVAIHVTGVVARAVVRQQFSNPSDNWVEGLYVFPLPDDAAVDHLRMRVGEHMIEGVVQERAAAKATYEHARQQGRRASLLEQERPNVFTASVATIAPGAAVSIEIEYQQVLRLDGGQVRLRFPMVVAPRYAPGMALAPGDPARTDGSGRVADTDEVPDASRITPPVRTTAAAPVNPVTITVDLVPGAPLTRLESPYHAVRTAPRGEGRYTVSLAGPAVPADRDFELVWELAAGSVPVASVATETAGGAVHALLMVVPPATAAIERRRPRREVVFVVDTSGSMAGRSIEQARAALAQALARLDPADTFNVIQFNSWTHALFDDAQPATPANRVVAGRYVAALTAQGGTEMLPALTHALDGLEHPGRLRQVIFLTDGAVGNEERLFQAIRERLGDSRLFTIGIGSAPNGHFMHEAARLGRGTFTDIGSTAEVQQKMEALFVKLESPALTDLQLELPGGVAVESYPPRIPDLYAGEPVVVALRAEALPPRAVLRGRLGGAPWAQEVWLQDADEGAGLAVHWARAKIAALVDRGRAGVAGADEVRAAVLEVALAHHLVSPYTSLVAVDVTPARPDGEPLRTHAIATNPPHGWDVARLGQGATAAPLHLAVGLAALLLAAGLVAIFRPVPPRRARRAA
jgi:Ca-activated chloride channel family protein